MLPRRLDVVENHDWATYPSPAFMLMTTIGRISFYITNSDLKKIKGVDLIRAIFLVPEEEIMPLINQDRVNAHLYFLKAYTLFKERTIERLSKVHDDQLVGGQSVHKGRLILSLDFYQEYFWDSKFNVQDYADTIPNKSSGSLWVTSSNIFNKTRGTRSYIRSNWELFRDCLIEVSDPYYENKSR